ncbi:MCE family protein [Nocardioides jiangxiensis]|uniref:MCE family protein n=1 Tax=Nocardioides jiangxiensis TaxID=3064524 RepID=A0ABT9AXI2_9ACTN|nr:MCE family protein [Nocardioides sp. WY-20]MDO7867252.1 MCE family protein [Nocardioides sp. WY-20]
MTGFRTLAAKCAAFGISGVLLIGLLYNTMTAGAGEAPRHFSATFVDVSGLRVGDDVRVAGVAVGHVDRIEVDGARARVAFSLTREQEITDTSGLVLRYQNLIGQRFLALVAGPKPGTALASGASIPVDRTSPGFDLTALLNGFRPLFQVLKPADINALSESIVQVLQGEGGTVSSLLRQTTELTNYLADRDKLFDRVAQNLTPLLVEVARTGPAMQQSVRQLASLTSGLARDRRTFGASIDGLSVAIGKTDRMVSAIRPDLRNDLRLLALVSRTYAANGKAWGRSFGDFGAVLEALGRSTSYRSAITTLVCNLTISSGDTRIPVGTPADRHSEVCR